MGWLFDFDGIFAHGGSDVLGLVLSFVNLWQISRKRRSGFLIGALANAAWLVFGFSTRSPATVFANALFGGMNLYAWVRWKHEEVAPAGARG
jgi:hypothetical protein